MSAKPSTLPRWADVGGAIAVPSSGRRDTGYTPGFKPLHDEDNWYRNLVYQWIVWLNDGNVALNNITCADLTATGNTLLGNAVGDTCAVSGPLTVGTTLTAGSAIKATDFLFTSTQTLYFSAADTGAPSANAPTYSVSHTTGVAVWNFTATTQLLATPLSRLRVGDRIISFGLRANTTPSLQLEMKLWFNNAALATTQVGTTLTHSNTAGDVSQTLGAPRTIAAGESFHATLGGTAAATTVTLLDVFVVIDRPV